MPGSLLWKLRRKEHAAKAGFRFLTRYNEVFQWKKRVVFLPPSRSLQHRPALPEASFPRQAFPGSSFCSVPLLFPPPFFTGCGPIVQTRGHERSRRGPHCGSRSGRCRSVTGCKERSERRSERALCVFRARPHAGGFAVLCRCGVTGAALRRKVSHGRKTGAGVRSGPDFLPINRRQSSWACVSIA